MRLELADVKARIERLDQLARGLAKEVGLQRGAEDVLLFRERRQYLRGIQDACVTLMPRDVQWRPRSASAVG